MKHYAKGPGMLSQPYVIQYVVQTIEAAVEKYPHLQSLCLAEKSYSTDEVEVDVLLGAHYFWNFVTNIFRKGRSPGQVAIWTKL